MPVDVVTRNVIVQILATNAPNGIDMTAISEVRLDRGAPGLTRSSRHRSERLARDPCRVVDHPSPTSEPVDQAWQAGECSAT